ncbi:bone morphogenetic protein receptor type-2 isoform X2 [Kryptolebias marmoratus]|uniref:bone morphogenetic protein receptor type-2 isoform X2 n=1 Tax=Kryptolebias marmoratus TaxID=37003 RepID=UPI0007F8CB9B|nr:bone morphogenetic protein receptor type-2 isoform X2 [Kryptolebias marmoratus]
MNANVGNSSHIPRNDTSSFFSFDSDAATMKLNGLWFLAVECVFLCFPRLSLLQKRQCVFQVNNKSNRKYAAFGNVSESVQLCENTHCCLAVYQIINELLKVDTLACCPVENSCPDETCMARPQMKNRFITCVCSTDLCNSNVTWTPAAEPPQRTHSYSTAETTKTAVIVILSIIGFVIITLKWRRFCQEKKENLQSSCKDYSIRRSCSCQTKTLENIITDVELQEVVGRGRFATVFQGRHNKSVVAVKVYPAGCKHKFTTEKEIYELPLMKHSGIVQFLGTGRKPDDGSWIIVLQYAEYGSLHSFLCKHSSSWMSSLKLCQSLSQGLSYLHSDLLSHGVHKPPVAHRDLSSFNVLVKADGTCALCDFGSSTILRFCSGYRFWQNHMANMKGQPQFGTLHYMSPEVLEGSVNLSSSSFLMQGDIYSLGLILWEICMRCSDLFEGGVAPQHLLPYELELEANVTVERLLLYVSEMDKRPSIPDYWGALPQGSALKELLTNCWDRDTDARLTAPCVVDRLASLTSSYPH